MKSIRLGMFMCLPFLLLGLYWAPVASAQISETLYGISYRGDLYEISQAPLSSPCGNRVRERLLGGQYDSFEALEYINGSFYAAYDGGKIVKFGFADGDEVYLGSTGIARLHAMARGPNNTLYIGYDNHVAKLSLSTLAVTDVVTVDDFTYNTQYIQALTWRNGALVVHWNHELHDDGGGSSFEIDPATGDVVSAMCPTGHTCWGPAWPLRALATREADQQIYSSEHAWSDNCSRPIDMHLGRVTFGEPDPEDQDYYPLHFITSLGGCSPPGGVDHCEYCFDLHPPISGLSFMSLGAGDCDPTNYLLLQDNIVTTQLQPFTRQGPIRAGNLGDGDYVITDGGNVTLNSGMEVRLEPGFSVQGTGLLQINVSETYCQ